MSINKFDKHIREKLAAHEVAPRPLVWENIETQLASSAKSQYRWLAGLLFVVVIAGATYYFTSMGSSTSPEAFPSSSSSDLQQQPNQTAMISTGEESTSENPQSVTQVEQLNSQSSIDQATEFAIAENTLSDQSDKMQKSQGETSFSAGLTKAQEAANYDNASGSTYSPRAESGPSAQNNSKATTEQADRMLTETDQTAAKPSFSSSENQSATVSEMQNTTAPENQSATVSNKEIADDDSPPLVQRAWENKQQFEAASVLTTDGKMHSPVQAAAFLTLEERQRKALNEFDICDVLFPSIEDCPKFGDRRRRYQIDAYSQVGMLFSHLTNNDLDVEVNSYLNQRRSTEVPTWYVGFGLRLSTQWTNGISLRGGLQVSESQIRVEYLDETQRQTTVNVSIDTLVDQDGNTTVVWDTISIIETGVETRQFHNTFTQIDIPLTVGYTFFGPRYDVEVNAGVMFNLLFQRSGRVFAPEDNAFYELGRTGAARGTQPYRSELGISLVTSVALNYRLSPQFSVFVEPQLRYFVDPVSPSSYALQENWFMGSLMLGGRYAF